MTVRGTHTSEVLSTGDFIAWLQRFGRLVAEHVDLLTELDSAIGDADHGINLARGTAAVESRIEASTTPAEVLRTTGMTVVSIVGGASGSLYGTFFLEAAKSLNDDDETVDLSQFAAAFGAGVDGIAARGRAWVGDKTMVDTLYPTMKALSSAAARGDTFADALSAAATAAAEGRESTRPLVARKGRASYLSERSEGHLDPGATSAALLVQALADTATVATVPDRVGIVVVSHSEALAAAAVDLAMQMVHSNPPPLQIAAGAAGAIGTDAAVVAAAIDAVASEYGVLVVTDLGSAVLSAGLALELRESTCPVIISDGPFVEGLTAALVLAAAGASLDEIAAEASSALQAKRTQLPDENPTNIEFSPASPDLTSRVAEYQLINHDGLHTRPAALLVKAVAGFDANVTIADVDNGQGPVNASSLVALLSLGATHGHVLQIYADGPDATAATAAIQTLIADGFGEPAALSH